MNKKILWAAGAIALTALFLFDPERTDVFPKCPFLSLTGWKCPGCGSQRAVHALLHGQIPEAFGFNALLVLSIPYLLPGAWLEWLGGSKRYPEARRRWFGPEAAKLWLVLVLLWWVGRNVFSL